MNPWYRIAAVTLTVLSLAGLLMGIIIETKLTGFAVATMLGLVLVRIEALIAMTRLTDDEETDN